MAGAGLSAGVTSTLCGEFGKSGHGIETSVEMIGQNTSYHTPFPSVSHTHTHTHTQYKGKNIDSNILLFKRKLQICVIFSLLSVRLN